MLDVLFNMLDILFNIGQSLSILVLLVGAYLAIAEASHTATSPMKTSNNTRSHESLDPYPACGANDDGNDDHGGGRNGGRPPGRLRMHSR